MPKYKVGEVLKTDGYKVQDDQKQFIKIIAIFGEYYLIPNPFYDAEARLVDEKWLRDHGYTLAQPARWVPEIGNNYWYVDGNGETERNMRWQNNSRDQFRLSINNVFQVGDHAGIEAFKRKLQEGKI